MSAWRRARSIACSRTLQEGGLVQQDTETDRYSLGLGFLRLTWKAADRHPVREVALPWMQQLVDATGETALLALYDPVRQEMLLAATIDSPHPIRQMRQVAEWLPVTAGRPDAPSSPSCRRPSGAPSSPARSPR